MTSDGINDAVSRLSADAAHEESYDYGRRSEQINTNSLLEQVFKRVDDDGPVRLTDPISVLNFTYDFTDLLKVSGILIIRDLTSNDWRFLKDAGFTMVQIAIIQLVLARYGLRIRDDASSLPIDCLPPPPTRPGGYIGNMEPTDESNWSRRGPRPNPMQPSGFVAGGFKDVDKLGGAERPQNLEPRTPGDGVEG